MRYTAILALLLSVANGAFPASVYIGVSKSKKSNAVKIFLVPFEPAKKDNAKDKQIAGYFQSIVRADLMYSRYFDIAENEFYISEKSAGADYLSIAKKLGTDYFITATARREADICILSVKLTENNTGEVMLDKTFSGNINEVRRTAHNASDEIILAASGKQGIASSRIAFANNSTGSKEIYVVDYDGRNLTRLTNDKSISLLPRWSGDGTKIYYTTYRYHNPDMFEIDMTAGKIRPVSYSQGINLPGGVSPDGKNMVLTMSRGKDPNIYMMDIDERKYKQLTRQKSVESSASYSPDGSYITFISDKSGSPQVHIMELATKRTQRLTGVNWADSPKWSPTGEWIVFAGRTSAKDDMDIFLVDITGSRLVRLTSNAGNNEDPSWSPDGRFIAFTTTRNKSKREIFIMDADGSAPHLIAKIDGKSYTPAWSR